MNSLCRSRSSFISLLLRPKVSLRGQRFADAARAALAPLPNPYHRALSLPVPEPLLSAGAPRVIGSLWDVLPNT